MLIARISLPLDFIRCTRVAKSSKGIINKALDLEVSTNSFNSFSINLYLLIYKLRILL
jgi:hypothetical protein